MTTPRSVGWYADPVTVGAARYWDGHGWTTSVAWGDRTLTDPTPLAEVERRAERHDHAITADYLDDAAKRGIVTPEIVTILRDDLLRNDLLGNARAEPTATISARPGRPVPSGATPTKVAPGFPAPRVPTRGTTPPARAPAPVPAPVPIAPGRASLWWDETRRTVRSDLALHGIAYLGVLLLFAGVTGLVVFSFGDVTPWVRSLTELMVPTALFISAWYLSTRGAKVVGDALALLGAAVTPIVAAAAFTDGAPIPPDIDGRLLPIVQGIAVAVVAIVMALVVRHHPSSPVRFLVGPIAWLAAGLAAGVLRDEVPTGAETAHPEALQFGVVLAALALTLLVCSIRDAKGPLASAVTAVALPTAGVVFVLELVFAGGEGWPMSSTIITGLAGLTLLEASSTRLSNSLISSLQFAVVGVTALRLSSIAEPQWIAVGTVAILLALAEYVGHRRSDRVAAWVGLAAVAMALSGTLAEPTTAAIGFGMLTVWGLWRHLAPADWLPIRDPYGFAPALGAAVTAGALWQLADPGVAVVAVSAAVLLLAITGRAWKPMSADVLWVWFVPAAAGAVWLASLRYEWGTFPVELAVAGTMTSAALALSSLPLAARVWTSAGALVWAFANAAEALGIGRDAQAIAVGVGGLVLVAGSLASARPVSVHLAAVGHLAGLCALALPIWPGWTPTVVVTLAALGWWMTTLVDDRGEAVHLAAVRRGLAANDAAASWPVHTVTELSGLAALALTVVVPASAILAADADVEASWVALASATGALLDASAVRAVRWTRARRRVFEWATFAVVMAATIAAIAEAGHIDDDWSPIATAAIGLAVIAIATAPRPLAFVWSAWVGGATITVLLGNRLGLDPETLDTLLTAWGAVVLVGGALTQRRRHGPLPQFRFGSDRRLLAPIVLGASAFGIGGMSALTDGSAGAIGWTAVAMAVVVFTVALVLPLAPLLAIAELLATSAYANLAPWDPAERPATFVPWVALLLVAALLTRRTREPWTARWDLPSFWVAHAVAGCALILAVVTDTVATTFALFATAALAIAVVLHRFEWAAGAAVLLLIAGADAGRGWLALVLAAEGLALTVTGLRRTGASRWTLVGAGAAALVGAWFDAVVWLGWSADTIVLVTVPLAAVLAFAAAALLRVHVVPAEAALVWAATGTLVSVASMIGGVDLVDRLAGGLTFAAAVLVLSATSAALVPVLGPAMRWVTAGTAAGAWLPAWWAVEPSASIATLVGTCVALSALVTAVAFHGLRPTYPWIAPLALYALATQALAALAALAVLPEHTLMVVVLLAASAELIALGAIRSQPELFVLAPAAACGAWLLAARDTLAGQPNWFTIPIGTTVLVMVGLVRWIRRGRGTPVTGYDVIAIEFVGMTVLVASPIAGILAGDLWNAILAVAIGAFIAIWGAITRVRRRAAFGASTVVLAIVLVIGVPLSSAVTWRGPALWVALSLLGIVAILVAASLERGRDAVRQVGRRLDVMTEGWERIPRNHPGSHPGSTDDQPPQATAGEAARNDPQPAR